MSRTEFLLHERISSNYTHLTSWIPFNQSSWVSFVKNELIFIECSLCARCCFRCLGYINEQRDQSLVPHRSCILVNALRMRDYDSELGPFCSAEVNICSFYNSHLALWSPLLSFSKVSTFVPKITVVMAGLAFTKCFLPQYTQPLYWKFLWTEMIPEHICIRWNQPVSLFDQLIHRKSPGLLKK